MTDMEKIIRGFELLMEAKGGEDDSLFDGCVAADHERIMCDGPEPRFLAPDVMKELHELGFYYEGDEDGWYTHV